MFHDEVTLDLIAGKGGDGSASFRREKYIPKGGPDGGDGGKGADVILMASRQETDLSRFASLREIKADNGQPGAGRKMYGHKGEDLVVSLPLGTRVYRQAGSNWRLIADLKKDGQQITLLRGGTGGLGNVHFATATHQTPRYAQPGEPGQRGRFKFELQLIADVGVIGMPNAGKSTFLSIISQAKPKIADYPFTTLSPVLGVVNHFDDSFVVADIPGLIEGASEGKGLGHTFLRHVTRTTSLVHMIDSLSPDYAADYQTIRHELGNFSEELLAKPEIVVLTKHELITEDMQEDVNAKVAALRSVITPPSQLFREVFISAVTKENIPALLQEIAAVVRAAKPADDEDSDSNQDD